MDKENVIYPYNGILAIESNEVLIQVTAWMKLENINMKVKR